MLDAMLVSSGGKFLLISLLISILLSVVSNAR